MPYFLLLLLSLAGSPLSSNHGALAVAASPPRGAEEAGWKSPEFPQTQIPPCSLWIEGTGCFLHPGSLRPPVPGLPPPACGGSQRTGFEGPSPACGSAQLHGEGTSQLCTHWCGLGAQLSRTVGAAHGIASLPTGQKHLRAQTPSEMDLPSCSFFSLSLPRVPTAEGALER